MAVRGIKQWIVASFIALFAVAALAKKAPPTPTERATRLGYVLLRVGQNSAVVGRNARRFDGAVIIDVDRKQVPRIKLENRSGSDRTLVLGVWVRPGRYRLFSGNGGWQQGSQISEFDFAMPDYFEAFEVRAGELTWLDTIEFQPLGGNDAMFVRFPSGMDARALLARHAPEVAAVLAEREPIEWPASKTWSVQSLSVLTRSNGLLINALANSRNERVAGAPNTPLRDAKTEAEMLAAMKKMPGKLLGGYITDDGTAYYGSSLGQIWRRDLDATWHTLDTGLVCDITSVALDGTTLYAGTELGGVLKSTDSGATFQKIAQVPNGFPVMRLDRMKQGAWVVSTQLLVPLPSGSYGYASSFENRRAFYVVDDLAQLPAANASLVVDAEYKEAPNSFPAMRQVLSAGPTPTGFAVFEPSDKLHLLDARTRAWRLGKPVPSRPRSLQFARYGTAIFTTLGGVKSNDGGQTWVQIESHFIPRYQVAYYDAKTGVSIAHRPTAVDDAEVLYTESGGADWTRVSKPPLFFCPAFAANEVLRQVYCLMDDGKIMSSSRGDVWTPETIAP